MNSTLQLKGVFEQKANDSRPGPPNLPKGKVVKVEHLEKIYDDLLRISEFWRNENVLSGILISAYYKKVAAKSNRVQGLLTNESVRGAKFIDDTDPKHVITHYISTQALRSSIQNLSVCIKIVKEQFGGIISHDVLKEINTEKILIKNKLIAKTMFAKIIVDAYYIEKFDILVEDVDLITESIVSIFNTGEKATDLLEKIGINIPNARVIENTTILLKPDELTILKQKAPYLISMAVSDLSELTKADFDFADDKELSIPAPQNEPTIGVIDTLFDEKVYFSGWVEHKNMLPKEIEVSKADYQHGTAVTSIIVDGPTLNPNLDDGCGRFRVRHFSVTTGNKFSSFTILRNIKEIISLNKDIKVWNLSLGSKLEINKNSISPEAAILDQIQYENDVIFIIAGTNKEPDEKGDKAIGSPADSINSIVVNSVDSKKLPASYTRVGPVLSFFTKPDISYYGGDQTNRIKVYTNKGNEYVYGTSFAAPWIARKMCYMISILGLSREVAKALLINSATTWDKQKHDSFLIGHGIVPQKIENVMNSQEDEIQFVLFGVSEKYDTYNYNIPVPISKDKQPFIARATLCYFPCCSRSQGVDYTNTELDISIGRLKNDSIKPIDNNYQSQKNGNYTLEEDARKLFRKWDNIKHVREILKDRSRPKQVYDKGLWGISLKTKNRLNSKDGIGIKFGIVVTLKEINGVNRIDDFIQNCQFRSWLVNKIDIENRIDIYNIAEEDINFEE